MKIQLQQQTTGLVKAAPIGFSWTCLFFGFWVPLFRGDFIWCLLCLLLDGVTVGLFHFIFPFIYNKIYLRKQLERGYQPANDFSRGLLINHNVIAPK